MIFIENERMKRSMISYNRCELLSYSLGIEINTRRKCFGDEIKNVLQTSTYICAFACR